MYKHQAKTGNLDWESILYEFPGKTLTYIKEFWKDIRVKVHPDFPAVKYGDFEFNINSIEVQPGGKRKKKLRIKEEEKEVDNFQPLG